MRPRIILDVLISWSTKNIDMFQPERSLDALIKKFMNTAMFQQAEKVTKLTNPNKLFNKALLSSLTSGHFIFKCVCLINTVYHHHPYSEKAFQVFIYHHRNFGKPSNFGLM